MEYDAAYWSSCLVEFSPCRTELLSLVGRTSNHWTVLLEFSHHALSLSLSLSLLLALSLSLAALLRGLAQSSLAMLCITRMQMSSEAIHLAEKCLPDSNLNLVCSHIVWDHFSVLKKSLHVRDQRGIIALKWTSFSAGQSNYCNCSSRHFLGGPGATVIEAL